jgi:hypothetical protein
MGNIPDELKPRILKLAEAINDSVNESGPVAQVIAELKSAGYDFALIIEATVVFRRIEAAPVIDAADEAASAEFVEQGGDDAWLRGLRIKVEPEDEPSL